VLALLTAILGELTGEAAGDLYEAGATVTPASWSWTGDLVQRAVAEAPVPVRRAGGPAEMAATVAFLCSDEVAYITGQTLFIDGDLTLYPAFETA
jgi:glucose 1-dehydrogenase